MKKQNMNARYIALVGMFAALSFVLVLVGRLVPNVAGFLSYDPKDAAVVIAGFLMGPLAGVLVTVIVSFIEMLSISTTGVYGLIMNIVSTCAFAVPATMIYKKMHTQKGAVIGLVTSVLVLAVTMVAWNYVITPLYMGVPRSVVAGMLASVFLPFNLIKGGINATLALLVYKPIVNALRAAKLVDAGSNNSKGKFNAAFVCVIAAVFVTFVLLLLAMAGIL